MPITTRRYVDQPFVRQSFVPSIGTLQDILGQQGQVQANLALQRGQGAASTWAGLANAFNQYQQTVKAREMQAAALAMKEQERQDAIGLKLLELDEKAKERAEQNRIRLETEGRLKRSDALSRAAAVVPGVISSEMADDLRPSGRVQVLDGAPVLMRTPEQLRQAGVDARAAKTAEELAADRKADNERQQAQFKAQQAHNAAMLKVAQQNAATSAANSQARIGGASALSPAYRNALERVLLTVPQNRRGARIEHANRLFNEQNEPELKDFIRQAAIEGENVDTKNQVLGRAATIASLKDTRDILNEMQKKGVPTGFLAGTWEDVLRRFGKSSNPEYVALANRLAGTLINYRRAATGAAFGEREGSAYEKMFPNYRNDPPVNLALIDGLMREMDTYDREYWTHKLGKDGAELVIGTGADTKKKANPNE